VTTDQWRLYFEIAQFILTGAVGVYVYLTNRDKVTNDRIGKLQEDLDEKLENHGERIARLETKSEKALTHNDLSELYKKVNDINGSVSTLTGEFVGVRNLLSTIHNHLLNGGKQ
jgi:hypothetical protein